MVPVILAKSAGEEQKLQITAVSNKGDLSFPAQQKSLIALANKAVSGSGVGEFLLFQLETLECGKFGNHEQ